MADLDVAKQVIDIPQRKRDADAEHYRQADGQAEREFYLAPLRQERQQFQ